MSETSIAVPTSMLKSFVENIPEALRPDMPAWLLQFDPTTMPLEDVTYPEPRGRRRQPSHPRRPRPRSKQTSTYQAKRAAMEDLPLKRLRRHGFTPYFGDEKRFLMTPPEFDLVLACEARQVAQVIHEVLRQSVGYPGDSADGRREWVALSFRHFERRGLLSHQDAKIALDYAVEQGYLLRRRRGQQRLEYAVHYRHVDIGTR